LLQAGHLPLGLLHLLPDCVIDLAMVLLVRSEHPLVHDLDLEKAQLHIIHEVQQVFHLRIALVLGEAVKFCQELQHGLPELEPGYHDPFVEDVIHY
jgi:hypothetical protein